MSTNQGAKPEIDRYLVIHVATTCDEHGVYVTKDSAEVIEIGWLLLDAKNCEEVSHMTCPFESVPMLTCGIVDPSRERLSQASQYTNNPVVQ